MKRYYRSSISALAVSAMVMGGVVVSVVGLSAVPAFSKNNNPNNEHRNENSEDRGRPDENRGAQPASLGALNAAHANAMALEHAAENSRVGMIAIYKAAVVASAEADAAVDEAQAALDLFMASCGEIVTGELEDSR
ncbi:MAG: hypothetical protein AAED33_10880 [Paracoccaceae bacterium]